MNTRTKITLAAAVAAITTAATLVSNPDEPPPPEPLTVWICCESDGSHREETLPSRCSPARDVVACCAPATEADGTVSCGC